MSRFSAAVRRMMTMRLCVSFGLTLAVAGVLATHRSGPDPTGAGVVFVYFPSLCAKAGDASDCHEIARPARPAFDTMAACWAFADVELRQAHNPRQLASCMRQRES